MFTVYLFQTDTKILNNELLLFEYSICIESYLMGY